jgi:cytochrome c-type biogenesis protein CcmH/NrfF
MKDGSLETGRGVRSPSITRRLRAARVLPFLAVFFALSGVTALSAQRMVDRPNAIEAERAIAQLRSPYCPGLMLETCPSPPAAALRDSIYDLAAQGLRTGEIVEWMLANHGEEYRGVPQRSGAGLWAWIIPPLALVLGVGAAIGWLRASRSEDEAGSLAEGGSDDLSDADRERLAAALREWEGSEEEVA